jgi:hypothetical protein
MTWLRLIATMNTCKRGSPGDSGLADAKTCGVRAT